MPHDQNKFWLAKIIDSRNIAENVNDFPSDVWRNYYYFCFEVKEEITKAGSFEYIKNYKLMYNNKNKIT